MHEFVSRIVLLWGWRRHAVAFVAGAVSILAFAPFNIFPVLFVTFPLLIWLLDGASAPAGSRGLRRILPAFAVGWTFGFGFFVAGLHWIGGAFLVEAEAFAWVLPFAVILLPAGLALFWAVAAVLARGLWSEDFRRVLSVALAFTAMEWLRGHVLTGFPWLLPGYALTATDSLAQAASVFGIYGLTFLSFAIFAAPAALSPRQASVSGVAFMLVALTSLAGLGAYGWTRLAQVQKVETSQTRVRVIQPNIAQNDKWVPKNKEDIFQLYLDLSDKALSPERAGIDGVDVLVWPESAPPFVLAEDAQALQKIDALLPPGTTLLTGAIRVARSETENGQSRLYNSLLALNDKAAIIAHYDKHILVPFGEYLPFKRVFNSIGITSLTATRGGYTAGNARKTLKVSNLPPFSPLICYEIIFSGAVTAPINRESAEILPRWLLNVTNDAWFGNSIGPYQHLQQARIRAIEEGLPLVRAANTGISAIVDPYGRIIDKVELNITGVLDIQLPTTLSTTLFLRHGIQIVIGLLSLSLLVVLSSRLRRRR